MSKKQQAGLCNGEFALKDIGRYRVTMIVPQSPASPDRAIALHRPPFTVSEGTLAQS
jgi:hypothetical protein